MQPDHGSIWRYLEGGEYRCRYDPGAVVFCGKGARFMRIERYRPHRRVGARGGPRPGGTAFYQPSLLFLYAFSDAAPEGVTGRRASSKRLTMPLVL